VSVNNDCIFIKKDFLWVSTSFMIMQRIRPEYPYRRHSKPKRPMRNAKNTSCSAAKWNLQARQKYATAGISPRPCPRHPYLPKIQNRPESLPGRAAYKKGGYLHRPPPFSLKQPIAGQRPAEDMKKTISASSRLCAEAP